MPLTTEEAQFVAQFEAKKQSLISTGERFLRELLQSRYNIAKFKTDNQDLYDAAYGVDFAADADLDALDVQLNSIIDACFATGTLSKTRTQMETEIANGNPPLFP